MVHLLAHSPRNASQRQTWSSFCETHTDLMTQILDVTHFNKVNRCCYDSDMEAFTLPESQCSMHVDA